MTHKDLRDKNVIVTGSSRRVGIGAAICRAFAEQGSNVFFTTYSSYDAQMDWGGRTGRVLLRCWKSC